MQFLAPLFFAAAAALSIPVIVHLIQRERREPIHFPSLMFISQVPYKSTRRRKIRNWFLFALRCLALLLLIGAFARPFVDSEAGAVTGLDLAREVVILVDRSYSMDYSDRWDRAQDAARTAIDDLGPADRGTIVFFDESAIAANQPTSDHVRLRAAVDSATTSAGATRFAPALKLAQSLLDASDLPRREVVLISDFQRVGWDNEGGVRLPGGTELRTVPILDQDPVNATIAAVTFQRELVSGRERVISTARITRKGGTAAVTVPVTLSVDGTQIEERQVELEGNGAATVEFGPIALVDRGVRGMVRIGDDELSADNTFHFVLSPDQAIRVLIVEGGGNASSFHVQAALETSERPAYRVETVPASQLRAANLENQSVVLFNDAAIPSGVIGQRLRDMVAAGAGVIVVVGERTGQGGWPDAADLVPGTPEPLSDRTSQGGGTLGYIDYSHPAFELFRAPRSGDFTSARFYRYHGIRVGQDSLASVLARFDDGRPALVERAFGEGRVLVFGSGLDRYWNELPVQNVYVPFVHQLISHAAAYAEPDPWFRVGQFVDVRASGRMQAADSSEIMSAQAAAEPSDLVIRAPSGARSNASASGLLQLVEQGVYEVRNSAGTAADTRFVAANLDVAESDLTPLDPQELASAVEPLGDAPTGLAGSLSIEERERRQSLWWYTLIAAFLILAAETVLSNRLSMRRQPAES